MKILVVSQYFWPEDFLINDFVLGLHARSHEVEVLTGLPNYPSGHFFRGYGYKGPYREDYHGIPVWRSPLIPRGNSSGLHLVINYLSFAFLSCLRGFLSCHRPIDIILFFQLSPIMVGIPARMMKMLTGAKMLCWIQDLWPESLSATGAVRSKLVLNWVGKLTQWTYRGCDLILIQSEAFRDSVLKYGAESDRIRYFPNCAEDIFQPIDVTAEAPVRDLMPEGFRVMFAGNIGISQDFETILAAAALTGSQGIQWVIVGDGRHRPWVEQEIQSLGLTNVHLIGRYPKEKMPVFFSLADVMLVSLKREPIFSLTIPSKIQAYLACGKPILASLDGEGARIIQEAQAGITVPAESPNVLADAVLKMAARDPKLLETMGCNARKYYEAHFSRTHLLDQFEGWLHETYCNSDNI
jgi:colanic acid biosynthesis glycosyl transferase WcaI